MAAARAKFGGASGEASSTAPPTRSPSASGGGWGFVGGVGGGGWVAEPADAQPVGERRRDEAVLGEEYRHRQVDP